MKPVLITVDDDREVLRAVERDLRRHYGENYRVLRAESGSSALEALKTLKLRNDPVALLLVDQRMPEMTGVEFLERAMELYPDAKRALLTAYADTDAAIRAINTARIEYYLMKPWDPPEEQLYPVLDDLLEDWQASFHPPFEGIRIVGHRWSAKSHLIKEFLARNHVPYQWLDIEKDEEARRLVNVAAASDLDLPLVLFADGSHLTEPSNAVIAEKIGLRTRAEQPFYDVIVVGAGPAGLAAAVYGSSEGLRTALIEREAPGGQAGMSSRIENYLGFPSGVSGDDLARRAVTQAKRFGTEILAQEVMGLRCDGPSRIVTLADGGIMECRALLIATGVSYRKLDVPGADTFTGAGVYYGAAMTEALSCRDEEVYVVGGANSAGQASVYFAKYAKRVTMLVRGSSLVQSMSRYLIDQIGEIPNIVVETDVHVVEVKGESSLQTITIAHVKTDERRTVATRYLFIFIGAMPHTEWLAGSVERDEHGFILTGPDLIQNGSRPQSWTLARDPFLLESSVPGIFVAGDVRHGSVKRVASGVGEGSIAVQFIHRYLAEA
jgi:thioredoxin reductase (NADPH)